MLTAARVEPGVDGCGTFLYRTGPRVGDEKVPLEYNIIILLANVKKVISEAPRGAVI